jgi:protein-S-isoprenylcysteine O-methyltransferase
MANPRDLALVLFFLWLSVDSVVMYRYKTGATENRDRFSLKVIVIGGPLAWCLSIVLAFGTMAAMHSPALQIGGLVVMALGVALRFTAIAQLGRFHSPNVAIHQDHRLIETGLYRIVRHPSYLGALIAFLGFSLALGNWLSVLAMMAIVPWLYLYRIREEDAVLLAAFGDSYRGYCRRTKRLIPWLY